jgi:hypothetical protein
MILGGLLLIAGGCHTIQLESNPPGAAVYVDGVYWGATPCSHTWYLGQKPAGYNASMILPGYDRSECPQLARGPGVAPQESLMTSAPPGGKIYVNGTYVGTTPMFRDLPFPNVIRTEWTPAQLARSKYRPPGQGNTPQTLQQPPPGAAVPSAAPRPVRGRFAVVIGLSEYMYRGKWGLTNLRYAADDAQKFSEYLQSPEGGRFDQVVVLTDAQATTRNIKIAIRERLRSVQKDDMVVIFWSGHGGPDPKDAKSLFLITHDTDPEHMSATGYAMDEFKTDIARLEADRVLILADTCHSAGISDPKIAYKGPTMNRIVEGIKGVHITDDSETSPELVGPLRMIFTSCETGETSIESSKLGNGHGAFTWFLLEGLKGQADKPKFGGNGSGTVTLGEVIEYTRDQVKRFTRNQQHPDTAGRFDRSVVMGTVK